MKSDLQVTADQASDMSYALSNKTTLKYESDKPIDKANKLKEYQRAKTQVAVDNATISPTSYFRVGDTIFINGLEGCAAGLYKVWKVTDTAVAYRALRWYEKVWHIAKHYYQKRFA
jgi:hypothetical protein